MLSVDLANHRQRAVPGSARPHYYRLRIISRSGVPKAREKSALERRPESQLQHPRLVSEIVVERRLAIIRIAFVGRIRAVVGVIEQVEHLEDAVDLPPFAKRKSLLEPHIHPVEGIAHEA